MKLSPKHILDRAGKASAFTLLEILIAVAALGLIAVGVASIFAATGKTVTTGRRLSAFNSYAALIEQQLRSDIASMSHKGFLLIRNEYATTDGSYPAFPAPQYLIPLYDGDESARPRRIDELMFFAEGEFQSARTPLDSSVVARSDAARIYYGHGQRRPSPATFNQNDPYYQPELNDTNGIGSSWLLGSGNPINPNRLASDWTLLRHVTLLCPPRTAPVTISPISGIPATALLDSSTQISLQPAASSIFRSLIATFPVTAFTQADAIRYLPAVAQHPSPASGLVDIATCDLSLIRSIFTTAKDTGAVTAQFYDPAANGSSTSEASNLGVDNIIRLQGPGTQDLLITRRMQSWMTDGLPAWSTGPAGSPNQLNQRARVRYEPAPPNFVGITAAFPGPPYTEQNYRRADQVMLSASNFLPRCTEFIVEWSFGKTYPSVNTQPGYVAGKEGQFIWHGMERRVGNLTTDLVAAPYTELDNANPQQRFITPYTLVNGTVVSTGPNAAMATSDLIHGLQIRPPFPPGPPLSSYFGYIDPTFNPDKFPAGGGSGNLEDPLDSMSPPIPWPWPKLIRVTLSLADPNDPSIERTFQFVFPVPDQDGV